MSHSLNPPQNTAVNTLRGPLLVLAGAGTGKTRVVTFRIAKLIQNGIKPDRILAVTFTNKAAAEMQERAAALLGKKSESRPEISTFHSLCVRILRRHIRHLGYPEQFAIYDRGDQEGVARSALRAIKVPGETLRPGDLLSIISRWKSASIRPEDAANIAATDKEHLAAAAFRRYQKELKSSGAVDFDDLLLLTEELFAKFAEIRRAEAQRFDHVLVDEYQDTNGSQYRIVKALATGHRNLCVVGDDDQSIYAWRGAEVTHILNFHRDWPEAKVVRLEDNYRSTEAILSLANRLIVCNLTRHDKTLRAARHGGEKPMIWQFKDEEEEALKVVEDISRRLSQPEVQPRDFAILFRTNEQPRPFETAFRALRVPYVLIGGMSFFDRSEVRDLLAFLKLLASAQDEVALLRIINKPPRGIGKAVVSRLQEAATEQGELLWQTVERVEGVEHLSSAATDAVIKFRELVTSYQQRLETERPLAVVQSLIVEIGLQDELRRLFPLDSDFDSRWAAVGEVLNELARYENRQKKNISLRGFLNQIALAEQEEADDKETQLARNAVALMTLHSAKGLEFPQVYLVGMEEGILPHKRSIESGDAAIDEERRLCYVGITRAQDRLTLSLALSRMRFGRSKETVPSRYLFEMTGVAKPEAEGGPRKKPSSGKRPVKKVKKKKPGK
jgi:DNA helicase II / ATP-dependent DNA helicase PcrA